jgi:hypothetical protein
MVGMAVVSQEQVPEQPVPLPHGKVKLHWHKRFNADAGTVWQRQTMAELFSGHALDAP